VSPFPRLKKETDPVSEMLNLKCRTMDKVHKSSDLMFYTPSSEPFRFCLFGTFFADRNCRFEISADQRNEVCFVFNQNKLILFYELKDISNENYTEISSDLV
jgi:hypothetical protein